MKCEKCEKEISMDEAKAIKGVGIFCDECYRKENCKTGNLNKEYNSPLSVTSNEQYRQNGVTNMLYYSSAFIFIAGFIMGIISGNKATIDSESFNTALMFYIWIGAFISGMFFVALGKIVDLLNDINNK